ncbi:MAG: GAF domain-containing protein [Bacteroidota bacterium]
MEPKGKQGGHIPEVTELTFEEMKARLLEAQDFSHRVNGLTEFVVHLEGARTREEIFRILQTEAKSLLQFDSAFIALLSPNRSQYFITSFGPTSDMLRPAHETGGAGEGRPGRVILEARAPLGDAPEGKWLDVGVKSMLMVPLRSGEEVLGTLSFGSYRPNAFNESDLWIGQLLALHVAIALRSISLTAGDRKREAHLTSMIKTLGELTSILEPDELLGAIPGAVQKHFNYYDVGVFAVRNEENQLILVGHTGSYAEYLPWSYKLSLDKGLVGWCAKNRERLVINDVTVDRRYVGPSNSTTKSALVMPIRSGNEIAAVLNIEEPKINAFDETDVFTFQAFCDQIGNAVRTATHYQELREKAERLDELDKLKTEFVGIVSHDFRSPLSSILLAARGLMKNEEFLQSKQAKEFLNIIIEQASRLSNLAEDTLSVTELEAGQLNYSFKILNVERLVQDAIAMVKFSSRHKLSYHVDQNVAYVKGDQNKLRQVVTNLISNAVKYSPQGGNVRVEVREFSPTEAMCGVSDEGVGIADDQKERLFRKFSRIDRKEGKEIRGAGLGLWICKEIVNAHGGKIWCESEMGRGSTFRFTLKKAMG